MSNENVTLVKLPEYFNHRPEQIGVWFPYNNSRYKDVYHIKLKDGTILHHMRPNGNGWYRALGSKPSDDPLIDAKRSNGVHDDDVTHLMLSVEDDTYPGKYNRHGEYRTQHQYYLFGIVVDKDGNEIKYSRDQFVEAGRYVNYDDL